MAGRGAQGHLSLWEATAPPAPALPVLSGDIRAQAAVIGAGYTGLSAALHLAEAGIDCVVIDRNGPGFGASGRNGGQVIAGLKQDPDTLESMFGATGAGLVAAIGAAPDLVFDLIGRFAIACQPVRTGWLQLAVSGSALRVVQARAAQWQARGVAIRLLDRADATRLSGSSAYLGGALDPRGGTVQPLAYARGLAAAAASRGARLFAGTAAVRLSPQTGGWRIETDAGAIDAAQVIIATNAYADRLHDGLRRSVVPVPSYQIASDPLPEALRRSILPDGQAVSDTRRLLRYFRVDDAGRLIMGGRGAFGQVSAGREALPHLQAVREIYPQAAGLAFPYRWGGLVAMTADHLPHLHRLAPGLYAGLGYNGRGVAMATLMGRALAGLVTGSEDPFLPVTRLAPLPLHRFSRTWASLAARYFGVLDRLNIN